MFAVCRNTSAALTITALLSLPLPALADMAEDQAAIRAIWEDYASFRVTGDAEAWLDLWDEDGIQMPPGVPARSIDTLRPVLADVFTKRPYEAMEISTEEIVVTGDWAYCRGTYSVDAGGKQIKGKFLTIFRRQDDGNWRIYRDIFNLNA